MYTSNLNDEIESPEDGVLSNTILTNYNLGLSTNFYELQSSIDKITLA